MPGESVRVQTLGGVWEWLGRDRHPSAKPEGLGYTYNEWGPEACGFTLKRDPASHHPDLLAFTPIEVVKGEQVVWAGFTIDTPGAGGDTPTLTVNALGWQYHGDDDVLEGFFVHSDLTEYGDIRARPDAPLAANAYNAGGQVSIDAGGITMMWPNGIAAQTNMLMGVVLDLGPVARGRIVTLDAAFSANAGAGTTVLAARFADRPGSRDGVQSFDDSFNTTALVAGPTSYNGGIVATPRRYVQILFQYNGGAFTFGADVWLRITGIRVFADAAYEDGAGKSKLVVSDVLKAAVAECPLWEQDTSLVTPTTLVLPSGDYRDGRTPRELVESYNAFHGYRLRMGGRGFKTLEFLPQANRAVLKVNTAKPGATFADASANSGREVYNRVIATGQTGAGVPVRVERFSRSSADTFGVPQPAGAWQVASGSSPSTLADSSTFNSSPDSTRFSTGPSEVVANLYQVIAGTLVAGRRYRLSFAARLPNASGLLNVSIRDLPKGGVPDVGGYVNSGYLTPVAPDELLLPVTTWQTFEYVWTQPVDAAGPVFEVWAYANVVGGATAWIDDVVLSELSGTLADRRHFARAKTISVEFPVDRLTLIGLADAWLAAHSRPVLKGSIDVTTDTAVNMLGVSDQVVRPVPTSELGRYMGELVMLENLIDPVTGEVGRLGVIAGVGVTEDGTASVDLDNGRTAFDALLARMGVRTS